MQQAQLQVQQQQQGSYFEQRAEAVEEIESRIAELGVLFHRVANLVSFQGEMVSRIDDEMDETMLNLEMGTQELQRYGEGIFSGRYLMMKVAGVLMAFALVFVFFFS